jgi:hypothetical protein
MRFDIPKIKSRETRPGQYQVYFSHQGKQIFLQRDASGDPLRDMDQVKAVICDLQGNGYDPAYWGKVKTHTFEKTVNDWVRLSDCSPEWLEKRKRIVKNIFVPSFGKIDVKDIPKINTKIREFNVHLKGRIGDKYRKNLIGELKTFFHSISDLLPRMPKFPKIKIQKPVIHWIGKESQDQIFEFIPDRYYHREILTLMRYTACRPNEAGGFLKENIQWHNSQFALATVLGKGKTIKKNTKNKQEKMFSFIPELEDALMKAKNDPSPFVFHINGRPYTTRRLEKIWDRANRLATEKYGTPRVNLYNGLKHSFGSQRLNDGYSYDEIAEVMGISPQMVRQRYAKYETKKLVSVMRGNRASVHAPFIEPLEAKSLKSQEKWSGREDLNLRHLTPHASALPGCATPRD